MHGAALGLTCRDALGIFAQYETLRLQMECERLSARVQVKDWAQGLSEARRGLRALILAQSGPPASLQIIQEGGMQECLGLWGPPFVDGVHSVLKRISPDLADHHTPQLVRDLRAAVFALNVWNDRFIALWEPGSLQTLVDIADGALARLAHDVVCIPHPLSLSRIHTTHKNSSE